MSGQPREFKREDGLLYQRCRTCKEYKLLELDFYVKHPELEFPYNRSTICKDCMKPIWSKDHKRILKVQNSKGLNSHYKPFKLRSAHLWSQIATLKSLT